MVDGKDLVRRYLQDVFSEGNLASMDEYLAGEAFQGRVSELVTRWRSAFSDFNVMVDEAYADNDRVVTVEILSGTHDGVFESRVGPIQPTGRQVRWSRIAIRQLEGDRFVDGFFEEDEVGLLEQLGVLNAAVTGRGRHSPLAPERR